MTDHECPDCGTVYKSYSAMMQCCQGWDSYDEDSIKELGKFII